MDSTPRRANTWEDGLNQFAGCWGGLEDPRTGNAGLHDFHELLALVLAVRWGGRVGHGAIRQSEGAIPARWPKFANGGAQPRHVSRLFRQLDPLQFRAAFQWFMASFSKTLEGVLAIDGEVLRRSFDRASGKSPLHMVSAWVASSAWYWRRSRLPTPTKAGAKSNEITAVPKLLRMLSLFDPLSRRRLQPRAARQGDAMTRAEFEEDLIRQGYEIREGGLEPNLHREAHAHGFDARVFVLDGSITLVFGEDRVTHGPADSCSVPAGTMHEEHTQADGVPYVSGHRSPAEATA
jgi:mannose-6-phosphate isomerase-like protein (cupin superfamily)